MFKDSRYTLDESDVLFLHRQLEQLMPQSKDVLYADLKARQFIPTAAGIDPAAETLTFDIYDYAGKAKVISDKSNDAPKVDVSARKVSYNMETIGDYYGYSVQEIKAAARAGQDLDGRRMRAAMRAIEVAIDDFLSDGSAKYGWEGFIDHSLVSTIDAAATGTLSSRAFADKTPDLIVADFAAAFGSMRSSSREVEGNRCRVIVPPTQYNKLAMTRLTDTGQTLKSFLEGTISEIEGIYSWHKLSGAGDTGDRMIIYTPSNEKVECAVAGEFEQLPPQAKGFEQEVYCSTRFGGLMLHYPGSMLYVDQI